MDNIDTNDLETHLLECYLFVDDYLQSHPKVAGWRRSVGEGRSLRQTRCRFLSVTQPVTAEPAC